MTAITAVERIAQAFWKQAFKRRVEFLLWIIKRPDAIQTLREIKTRKVGGQKVPKGPHQKCEMPLIGAADLEQLDKPASQKYWHSKRPHKPVESPQCSGRSRICNWINHLKILTHYFWWKSYISWIFYNDLMETGKNRHHFFINCAFPNFLYICLWFDF